MQNNHDFGFNTEEFLGELSSIPYAQFFNASDEKFGIAVTGTNAELAKFSNSHFEEEYKLSSFVYIEKLLVVCF